MTGGRAEGTSKEAFTGGAPLFASRFVDRTGQRPSDMRLPRPTLGMQESDVHLFSGVHPADVAWKSSVPSGRWHGLDTLARRPHARPADGSHAAAGAPVAHSGPDCAVRESPHDVLSADAGE